MAEQDESSDKLRRNGNERRTAGLFSICFLLGGSLFLYVGFVKPAWQVIDASDWPEAPCVILASKVASDQGSFRIEVLYKYEVDDRQYQSSRYSFALGGSPGRGGNQEVVDRLSPGKQTVCYVNPDNPRFAVIERDLTSDMWWALFPLLFVLIGIGFGVRWIVLLRRGRRQFEGPEGSTPPSPKADTPLPLAGVGRLFAVLSCVVLLLMLVIAGGACWLSSEIRPVAHEFITALESENYKRAFELCSPGLQERLGGTQGLKELTADGNEFWEPSFWTSMTAGKQTASLGSHGAWLRFEKVGSRWCVSHFSWATSAGGGLKLP